MLTVRTCILVYSALTGLNLLHFCNWWNRDLIWAGVRLSNIGCRFCAAVINAKPGSDPLLRKFAKIFRSKFNSSSVHGTRIAGFRILLAGGQLFVGCLAGMSSSESSGSRILLRCCCCCFTAVAPSSLASLWSLTVSVRFPVEMYQIRHHHHHHTIYKVPIIAKRNSHNKKQITTINSYLT